jgi:hypothetical protein
MWENAVFAEQVIRNASDDMHRAAERHRVLLESSDQVVRRRSNGPSRALRRLSR